MLGKYYNVNIIKSRFRKLLKREAAMGAAPRAAGQGEGEHPGTEMGENRPSNQHDYSQSPN